MQEQNWVSEQEAHKRAHSFSFQQALLSAKDYKIIFAIAVIIVIWRMMLEIPEVLNWQLTGWQYVVHAVILKTTLVIIGCALLLIPVMLWLRAKVTCELQENIQKLDQALSEQEQISSLSHGLCK
ncbi:hypothetical protein [Bartonella tribocorum]|uniref:hypothetical protein n=1 Tax=Bartonella tribocorum TaxID=85701 RepID=UPI000304B262|nr:hypothetical protein [Bartonella tribocorum]CDO49571.1 hypothetical membrane protein [Bartonella tribocorum]